MIIQGKKLIQLKKAYQAYLEKLEIEWKSNSNTNFIENNILFEEISDIEEFIKDIDYCINKES